jgi:hypothetical protein
VNSETGVSVSNFRLGLCAFRLFIDPMRKGSDDCCLRVVQKLWYPLLATLKVQIGKASGGLIR